jgi:uroporphyrinogen decarboxylase
VKLLAALNKEPLDTPPLWLMRQAGRFLPEYRELRTRYSFQEAVGTPEIAAEITLQPVRRFGFDAAILFADIMTPLEAMGVEMTFDPGPRLTRMTLAEIADLPELTTEHVSQVAETVRLVRSELSAQTALIGFAGAPITLMAYLLEGGGSKDFVALRAALRDDPVAGLAAAQHLGRAMHTYLQVQIDAGVNVVQLFDTWLGVLDVTTARTIGLMGARDALQGLAVPRIYFAPHAHHVQPFMSIVGATGYGVDWRESIDTQWDRIGADTVIQGNLDPATLLSEPATIQHAVEDILRRTAGRPGHIFNLGHGIDKDTPIGHVTALVRAVRGEI